MTPGPGTPTVRLRRLGATLRRLREGAGLTLEDAASRMERSLSSLSKIENGRVWIPPRDVRVILDVYEVTDERMRDALLALSRDARRRGWWQRYGDVLSAAYLDFISLEADAAAERCFETVLVPGLLQTADYVRALYEAVPAPRSRHDIDQLIAVRMARQEVLTRSDPLKLWVIIGEAVLHHNVGGREVMGVQLDRLIQAARLDNVTLQVLPFSLGAHAGINGPFTILEFPEFGDLDVVQVESLTSGLYLEQEDDIRRYNLVFDHLRAAALPALPAADSITKIEQIARSLL